MTALLKASACDVQAALSRHVFAIPILQAEVRAILLDSLSHSEACVKVAALEALGSADQGADLFDEKMLRSLVQCESDPDPSVRSAASLLRLSSPTVYDRERAAQLDRMIPSSELEGLFYVSGCEESKVGGD